MKRNIQEGRDSEREEQKLKQKKGFSEMNAF